MAATSVLGSSPVNILTKAGKQFGIPLSILSIEKGAVDTSSLGKALGKVGEEGKLVLDEEGESVLDAANLVLKALLHSGAIAPDKASAAGAGADA